MAATRAGRIWRRIGIGVGILVLLLAVVPLLWPVPPLEGTVPPRELADADSRFVDVDGIEFHYKESGPATATTNVLLLHGFGASAYSWRDTLPALGQEFRTVAFDRPAFGLTARPMSWTGANPYSRAAQAEQTVALMDALGIDKAVLVGHSAGAAVAVLVASEHPERVSGLVLEGPAVISGGGAPSWIAPLLRTPQMNHIGPLIARRLGNASSDTFIKGAFYDRSKATPELLAGYRKPLQAENWDRALWYLTAASDETDYRDILPTLAMPVLVVWGDHDTFVPPADSQTVSELLPNAASIVFTDVGHIPHEESPELFNADVRGFISGLDDELPTQQ